jgi:hypothetical protein
MKGIMSKNVRVELEKNQVYFLIGYLAIRIDLINKNRISCINKGALITAMYWQRELNHTKDIMEILQASV